MKEWIQIIDFGLLILIWLVQLVIYPSFSKIDDRKFSEWHSSYVNRITSVVTPLMVVQAYMHLWQMINEFGFFSAANVGLIVMVWIVTLAFSWPCHKKLKNEGFDNAIHKRLVITNWLRTFGWTLVFVLFIAEKMLLANL